ncbi:MAG TPA: glycosyltransferase family 39 protein [Jatrophihabitans sp.]|jgi:4-amino-4-deoxy-L-arabinose transferase-like glycosyltransferase
MRRLVVAVPKTLWLIVALQTFVLICATIVYPAFQEADEAQHIDYVLAHRHGDWLTDPGKRWPQIGVLDAYGSEPNIATGQHLGDRAAVPRTHRPSFDHISTKLAPTASVPNQMTQHPFGYYGLAAGWSYLLPGFEGRGWDVQVFWLRLLSVLLMIPVPLLIYFSARRLTRHHAVALVATILPAAVPSYLRIGASVTNDVLLTLLGALMMYELSKVISGDLRRSTALRVGLWWALALLTKGIALIMPPVIILAYLVAANGSLRNRVRTAVLPCLTAGLTGFVLGGWWYVRNLVDFGAVQPKGKGPEWTVQRIYGVDHSGTNTSFVTGFFSRLGVRFFGSLGIIERPGWPNDLLVAFFAAMLALVVVGIVVGIRRASAPRWAAVALLSPSVICLASIMVKIRHTYLISHVFPGIQVRYLLGFIGGLTIVLAVALFVLLRRIARWLAATVFALVGLFEAANVLLLLAQQYGTTSGSVTHRIGKGIDYLIDWAPFAAGVTWTFVGLATATAIATFVVLLRSSESAPALAGYADATSVPRVDQASAIRPSSADEASQSADGNTRTV